MTDPHPSVISSMVVTAHADGLDDLLSHLAGDPRFTVGDRDGLRVAVVSEDHNHDEAEHTFRCLSDLHSVEFVDLVSVFLDTDQG